ncbi:PaaI family thioesterase [Capnocytophaga canimorsus]|uniref:Thioesterase n=1 Tax=Capnocytophaga canimorsus TaxID=28188 RepID=A0AAD0E863_9FLAO|nr:PaaI family thioesterase [Capnocytophaga canimorsus]ATA93485.1 thioesterase [Capnocytophaga canimorsus]CEN47633.1 putative enzyme [Capnocytophaga canimorsus]
MITNKTEILKKLNDTSKGNFMAYLGIEYVDVGTDYLTAKMRVTQNLTQIDGVLHGGATISLAETVGSAAAFFLFSAENQKVRGVELSANHLKSVKVGETVFAKASCVHRGKTIQLWQIKVTDEHQNLISLCKLSTVTIS